VKVRLSENVVFRSFGSETVLLNLKSGQYHGVKGSGGRMLEVLAETGDVDACAQLIADEYGHPLEDVSRDLNELCDALAKRDLIEIDDEAARR
jgi:Coenzyme PQQ synthesis protein D (PqqD)